MVRADLQNDLRIVSLIPSATEIVDCLGYGQYLVGRSHECDFPTYVRDLPICTEPKFDPAGSSGEIHGRVSELLTSALSVYRVKTEVLAQLRPTHIIKQAQCEVCAVSLGDVAQAVATLVADSGDSANARADDSAKPIQIVSLQPNRLTDVWADIERVGAILSGEGASEHSVRSSSDRSLPAPKAVVKKLMAQLDNIATPEIVGTESEKPRPKVACIEWSEPLMAAGNWVPELVALAGGEDCFGKAGEHSDWMSWEALAAADPDILVVMPCGYDLAATRQATVEKSVHPTWKALSAVKNNRVYLTDGNQYFNRPGPRLVDSGEILAEIIQNRPINPARSSTGWEKF